MSTTATMALVRPFINPLSNTADVRQKAEPYQSILWISSPRSIDRIITSKYLSMFEKKRLIAQILEYGSHLGIGIDSQTMTELLEIKEESIDFLELYISILRYASNEKLSIFSYEHLYRLVQQSWMDVPLTISNFFKKQLIANALNGFLPPDLISKIHTDSSDWFDNIENNKSLAEMVEWICHMDKSGKLFLSKNAYLATLQMEMMDTKLFQKVNNITKNEYYAQQQKAKKNGLCKFSREGTTCLNGPNCKFYHGKIEETYGVQACRNGSSCIHFAKGDCKFVHDPTERQIVVTRNFYQSLKKYRDGFLVTSGQIEMVEREMKNNPFVILRMEKKTTTGYYFIIPQCQCLIDDNGRKCDKPVHFITRKNGEPKYYCSYEHMAKCDPESSYRVKYQFSALIQCIPCTI